MPGLLDMFANPEATAQLGAGLLSGNFGAGATGYFQAINTQRQNALKEQMLKAQLGEIAAQTQQRQAEASKQMAALQQQQKVQQLLQSFGQVPKGMGATDQVNSALPAEMQIGAQPALRPNNDYASLIKGGVPTELVKALAESRNYGRDEVARTEETTDAQGRPIKRQYTKFGDSVGGDMPQWKAPVSVNQGNKTTFVDPVSMRQAGSFQTFQSPESVASTALGWANNAATLRGQNLTDARMRDQNSISQMGKVADTSTNLRKEFESLPEVKNYKQALPSYKAIEDAVTRNTPQSDINIVYGLAKLYDPTSVVREGEYSTVANSPNIPEKVKGYAQYIAGGGKLSPATKAQILQEAQSRIQTYENPFNQATANYSDIAKRSGAEPSLLFPTPNQPAVKPSTGGATGDFSPPKGQGKLLAELPKMARKGQKARDTTSNDVYVFDGRSWVKE